MFKVFLIEPAQVSLIQRAVQEVVGETRFYSLHKNFEMCFPIPGGGGWGVYACVMVIYFSTDFNGIEEVRENLEQRFGKTILVAPAETSWTSDEEIDWSGFGHWKEGEDIL